MSQLAEQTRAISVTKLHPVIGVEIPGVDLSLPLREETLRQIKDAWHEHTVLLFHDRTLAKRSSADSLPISARSRSGYRRSRVRRARPMRWSGTT